MAPLVGRTLGDFVLVERIGAGSFGAVYRAEQPLLARDAAVKVLHARSADPRAVERFLREVRLASRLDHPFAAHVYASGAEADGVLWIAMELVRGTTLDEILGARGPLALERFLPFFERLCEVVHAAHEQGIVHGDIKPANVMVLARGGRLSPKLLDLGVARTLLDEGQAAGSPAYMPPERAAGPRGDVYALGVLAFQSLTGRLPPGEGPSPELQAVIARALAPRPEDRFPSAFELAAAFRAASGVGAAVEALPRLDEPLRDAWLAGAPQPIAEAVAALDGARNAHQARDALRDVVHVLVRWLGLLALASRAAGDGHDGPRVVDLLRALRRRGLDDAEWLELLAQLCRPFQAHPAAHAIPELVASAGALEDLLALDAAGSAAEQVRELLAAGVPRLGVALRSLAFLLEYPVAVPRGEVADAWMGVRRAHGAGLPTLWLSGPPAPEGRLVLCDPEGRPRLSLWPLVQVEAPSPGTPETLFLLDGPARRGARLVAAPFGFAISSDAVWGWLAERVPFGEAPDGAPTEEISPYRGLEPFAAADAERFVGREREVEAFVNRLRIASLLAVVGPSGVGKSSFIHAGVLPNLPEGWRAAVIRPGATPMARLPREELDVLVVDQFEEVFTLCPDPAERARFARTLAAAPMRVVLTLRDDFLGRAGELEGLRQRLGRGLELLATPRAEDLARILVEPARRAGYEFEDPELPARMVAAVADQPSALPLLSFTAARLWELRDRHFKLLPRRAYEALGGVEGALARHAEETLSAMPASWQRLVRAAFAHLVTAEGTRASLTRAELRQVTGGAAETDAVIEALVGARLLSASEDERIEVTHEALLETWPRLAAWRREDAEGARLRDQLRAAARQWDERTRPRGLLWRDEALDEYRVWRRRHAEPLLAVEEDFAAASLADAARGRRIRRALLVAAALALTAGLAGLYAANRQAELRLRELYADRGRDALLAGDPFRALPYLSEAYSMGADGPVIRFLLAQAARPLLRPPLVLEGGSMSQVAWSPDGRKIFTTGDRAVLWDAGTGAATVELAGQGTSLGELAGDGRLALTVARAEAQVWSVDDGRLVATCVSPGNPIVVATFSPDARRLAVGGEGGSVALCDSATGELRRLEGATTGIVDALAFSPDGRRLAAAGRDGVVVVFDVATGQLVATLRGHENPVQVLAFSPDGDRLASGPSAAQGGTDTAIRLWDVPGGRDLAILRGHAHTIMSLDFSPAGDRLLSSSMDSTAKIWDATTGALLASLQDVAMGSVFQASYAPDGATVATGSADGTVRIWDAGSGALVGSLVGHRHIVHGVAFSPDGTRLATASLDGTGRIWRLGDATLARSFVAHAGAVVSVAFDPAGGRLVTLGKDAAVRLWDVRTAKLLGEQHVEASGIQRRAGFSPDGRRVVAPDGARLQLWDLASGARTFESGAGAVIAAAFGDGGTLVSGGQGGTRVRDARDGRLVRAFDDGHVVWDVAPSPDGRRVASAGEDGVLRLWDVPTGGLVRSFHAHEGALTSAAFCDDGRWLATAGVDRRASITSVAGDGPALSLEGHGGVVLDVAFSPGCALLVTTGGDRTARVWSAADGVPLLVLRGHSASVQSVAFAPGGSMLATAGSDGKVNLWEIGYEDRPPDEVARWVRCHVPYRLREGHLVAQATECR